MSDQERPKTYADYQDELESLPEVEVSRSGEELENNTQERQKHLITVDDSLSEVLEWNQLGDILLFDHRSFLELPEEAIKDLRYENQRAYFVARGMKLAVEKPKARKERKLIDPFSDRIVKRVKAVKKRYKKDNGEEWHQTWVDEANVDEMKTIGYKPVRHPDPERKGEIMKLMNGDKVEAVAMEIPYQLYDDHIHAMSEKSQRAYTQYKKATEERIAKDYGLKMLDEEDENQAEYMKWLASHMEEVT